MAGLQSGPSSWGQPKVVAKHLLAKFLGEDLLLPLKQKFLTKRPQTFFLFSVWMLDDLVHMLIVSMFHVTDSTHGKFQMFLSSGMMGRNSLVR
jgi:hypothetical protein